MAAGRGPAQDGETIAAGTLDAAGRRHVHAAFTPAADERLAAANAEGPDATRYDGRRPTPRTRAARRARRRGRSASASSRSRRASDLPRRLRPSQGAVRASRSCARISTACRAPGRDRWRLCPARAAEAAALPADVARRSSGPAEGGLRTPGDACARAGRPTTSPERVLRELDGRRRDRARRASPTTRRARRAIAVAGAAAPGAYRLRYETRDEFGADVRGAEGFLVAGQDDAARPAGRAARRGELGRRRRDGAAPRGLGPARPAHRPRDRSRRPAASSGATLTAGAVAGRDRDPDRGEGPRRLRREAALVLRDHQLVTLTQTVFVPWDDKELAGLASRRSATGSGPASAETWTVKVEGPNGRAARGRRRPSFSRTCTTGASTRSCRTSRRARCRCIRTGPAVAWSRASLGEDRFPARRPVRFRACPTGRALSAGPAQVLRRIRASAVPAGADVRDVEIAARCTDRRRRGVRVAASAAMEGVAPKDEGRRGARRRTPAAIAAGAEPASRCAATSPRRRSGSRTC